MSFIWVNQACGRRASGWLLTALLTAIAFLLGCYEMADSDIWWHLSGGRWILEHGRVPHLDPFTFGSEDRVWVDIHWGFQVLMSGVYRWGGVAGLILAAASAAGLTFVVAVTARRREWPIALGLLCWVPALILMSWRFDPRPEIFTLLYIACFLAILWRVDQRPALVWILPLLQIAWVNSQGLFLLGPILVAFYLCDKAFTYLSRRWRGGTRVSLAERAWCLQVSAGALAVVGACFLNPYLVDGVRFPFELFPKVTQPGNIYKEYIDELASPRQLLERSADNDWYLRNLYLLLLILPVSFLLPALWRSWNAAVQTQRERRATADARFSRLGVWLGVLVATFGLLILSTLSFLPARRNQWAGAFLTAVPFALFGISSIAAVSLMRRSRATGVLALVAGLTLALWMTWLRIEFLSTDTDGPPALAPYLLISGLAAIALTVHQGGSLFRILLALAFGYLSLQAVQNASRFALVAGMICAWNFGEWMHDLFACKERPFGPARVGAAIRLGLGIALLLWLGALVTDHYYGWTGSGRHFLFREQPFEFAHDAIRFAGQTAQPEHALVYDLGQTGLFDFYNVPAHKQFMDGRLEMPSRATFQTYINIEKWLQERDVRWESAVHQLRDPLILLTHLQNYDAEAVLLTHSQWRCIYWDALATVFVHGGSSGLQQSYPSVDFAGRHFQEASAPSTPNLPGSAFREARALYNLATALRRDSSATWTWRIPVSLLALDRGALALSEDGRRSAPWTLLGNCYWNLIPDLGKPPPTPADQWDPAAVIPWAQATYCYRRALDLAPGDVTALRYLINALRVRRMADEQLAVGQSLVAFGQASPAEAAELAALARNPSLAPTGRGALGADFPARIDYLLQMGQPKAAAEVADQMPASTVSWAVAERVAPLYLHLGRPADARRIWHGAAGAPSKSERLGREALTYWVERDFEQAAELYRQALAAEPRFAEAWWGMAMLSAQLGRAKDTLEYCEKGLRLPLTDRQRTDLRFKTLLTK
jgi:tetratricopeptide (TPR) repeat protein